jgi:quercetin dioxygenase-like cupin family protein
MKIKLDKIGGEEIKNNDTYTITDNNYLEHLTMSRTVLKASQMTKGHSHDRQEEVYTFTHGEALMQVGDIYHHAKEGDTFLIKTGEFHRVFNKSTTSTCAFTCIFEKYDRAGNEAKY